MDYQDLYIMDIPCFLDLTSFILFLVFTTRESMAITHIQVYTIVQYHGVFVMVIILTGPICRRLGLFSYRTQTTGCIRSLSQEPLFHDQ